MIQFNLLPDIKLEYLRAQRTKRLVMVVSSAVSAVALVIFIALLIDVSFVQKTHMSNLSDDIERTAKDLEGTSDIDKILTVQNQLNSLPGLHEQKPAVKRIFPYIQEVTPTEASIATLNLDFDNTVMTITGAADTLNTVNKFVDTLKFTEYSVGEDGEKTRAFSQVVLTSFGRADKGASYTINLAFDPVIFDNTESIKLTVPNIVTTRSEISKPGILFEPVTNDDPSNLNGAQE